MARTKGWWQPVADIASGEIVPAGRPITIGGGAFAADSAHAVVVSGSGSAAVRHDRKSGRLVVETADLAPGFHQLVVDGVPAGKEARQEFRTEFVVVETAAPLSTEHVVTHAVRLRISLVRDRLDPAQHAVRHFRLDQLRTGVRLTPG